MAITDGLFQLTFRDQFDTSALGVDLLNAGMKLALYNTSATSAYQTDTKYDLNGWVTANEVDEGGAPWPAGGIALDTPLLTAETLGILKYDATNLSVGEAQRLAMTSNSPSRWAWLSPDNS